MWKRLEDEHFIRAEANPDRPGFGTVHRAVAADEDGALTMQRWVHADGRRAVHVSDADPELLVLDPATMILREYDLPGAAVTPDGTDPLRGATLVRSVGVGDPDRGDADLSDAEAWDLLRGWS